MTTQTALSRGLRALIVLIILVSINLLAGRFFTRWDLTQNKDYTLSESTVNVLQRLDDVVNITVYFSEDLPSYFATLDRQVKDLLDEYRAKGGESVRVQFIDPTGDPVREQTVQTLGIPRRPVTIYEKEKAEATSIFLGIAVQYEDNTEVLPWVEDVGRLEYDLTSAVVKASSPRKTVGIVAGPGGTIPDTYQGLQSILRDQYLVRGLDLVAAPVPLDISTLVVADHDGLTDIALYRLDQFLMRGGRALFMTSGVRVNMSTLQATDRASKLAPLLETYGVELGSGMVVDAQAARVAFDVGSFLPLSLRYPWFPQVIESGFSKDNSITNRMQSLVLPWTSPLQVNGDAGDNIEVLAQSSDQSFVTPAPYNLNPQGTLAPPLNGVSPQTLAAAVTGSLSSHWAEGLTPADTTAGATGDGERITLSPPTQIVVVGNDNFLQTRFLQQFPGNALFAANSVDWMTLGEDLIAIRARAATTRPLREVEDSKRGLLKTLAIFPVPVLVVLFGLLRARWQKRRRRRLAREFQTAT